jgi:hypothetical protein
VRMEPDAPSHIARLRAAGYRLADRQGV